MQRLDPRRARVYDNLRNPAAPPFPHSLGIPGGIFHETRGRERGSSVNSPPVYERATLESGLTLEDPRLGAIDRQLDARICRVAGARAPIYTGERVDGATCTYLWKAAGIRTPDVLLYLARSVPRWKIRTSGLLAPRQNDDPGTRGYATLLCNRARSLSMRYIFFAVSLLLTPFCLPFVSAARLHFPPLDAMFLPPVVGPFLGVAGISHN